MSTEFFKKYNAQLKQLSESYDMGGNVYEVNLTLMLQDFVEANSEEEAEQNFREMWSSVDELLDHASITVTEAPNYYKP